MLQPRETDLTVLFLVFVVLPLVVYILLGKWSEAAKKKEKISVLAHIAAEEAIRAESMAAATIIPPVPLSNSVMHECARCFSPATTRCSRCKSVRYCSGKCQIVHWRQVHKHECHLLEYNSSIGSPKSASNEESKHENYIVDETVDSQWFEYNTEQPGVEKHLSNEITNPHVSEVTFASSSGMPMDASEHIMERRVIDKHGSRKPYRELIRREEADILEPSGETSRHGATCSTSYNNTSCKETFIRHKHKHNYPMFSKEETQEKSSANMPADLSGCTVPRSARHDNPKACGQNGNAVRTNIGFFDSTKSAQNVRHSHDIEMELIDGWNLHKGGSTASNETAETNCSSEKGSMKRSGTVKTASHSTGTNARKSPKSTSKVSRNHSCSDMEWKNQFVDESIVSSMRETSHTHGGNSVANSRFMKLIGLKRSSKHDRSESSEINGDRKKIKMLFPYEEFVKLFQYEVSELLPRGLVNCGNSCYANAVLQCLTCTKPLTVYLLRRSHSRARCVKDWCLMCELEQHVLMLRESGDPLSLNRILLHMRSANWQIGDGSQEDAHEFLRLLVTSMQSICLEGWGGEDAVDPRLQETTFIQHTFGGKLRSKVKCLRCHHESERYENIMDLTLEIFGWVESLEDALTQFTSPEDLDGENMYRCGRCATYVRAQKQLGIQEAPNILTIVLKRFQEGSYGKINKCITFPDMLDMIPFMTGAGDVPPLYMLYAVVVHLDTMNASFSGHYISYVKDQHGNWLRIDDTQVLPVPLSHVMSEGAYILFYMRSCPRPSRACTEIPARQEASFAKHRMSKVPKSTSDHRQDTMGYQGNFNRNLLPVRSTCAKPSSMDFSDVTSSDWSIFTSSDDASFTTESTRDSFSTVDYECNNNPISSIFNSFYTAPEYLSRSTVSCNRISSSSPYTRFFTGGKCSAVDSHHSAQPPYRLHRAENAKHVRICSTETYPSSRSHCGLYTKYECSHKEGLHRTPGQCTL